MGLTINLWRRVLARSRHQTFNAIQPSSMIRSLTPLQPALSFHCPSLVLKSLKSTASESSTRVRASLGPAASTSLRPQRCTEMGMTYWLETARSRPVVRDDVFMRSSGRHTRARRSSCALIATMIVLADISTAPSAGGGTMPQGASTPAASGIATRL